MHGEPDTTELGGDFLIGATLQLPQRNRAQLVVAQEFQQPPILFRHLDGELGRRLLADHFVQAYLLFAGCRSAPCCLVLDCPAAALLPPFIALQMDGFASRDRDQEPPEVIPIGKLRELAAAGAVAEAGEGTESHILFVGGAARSVR